MSGRRECSGVELRRWKLRTSADYAVACLPACLHSPPIRLAPFLLLLLLLGGRRPRPFHLPLPSCEVSSASLVHPYFVVVFVVAEGERDWLGLL